MAAAEDIRNLMIGRNPEEADYWSGLPAKEVYEEYAQRDPGKPGEPSLGEMSLGNVKLRRAQQARLAGRMLNWLLTAGGVGAGLGLTSRLPKLLKLEKELKAVPGAKDREKQSAVGGIGEEPFKITPESDVWTALGPLPSGTLLGAGGLAALMGSAYGANLLTEKLIDRWRAKRIQDRKEQLREEFENLLTYDKSSALSEAIDLLAADWMEKDAQGEESLVRRYSRPAIAMLSGAGLLSLLLGLQTGHTLAGTGAGDPLKLKAKAVEHALRAKRYGRRPRLQLVASEDDDEEVVEPEVLPAVREVPIKLPAAPTEEYDEAFDLSKLSSLTKYAQGIASPVAAQPQAGGGMVNPIGRGLGKLVQPIGRALGPLYQAGKSYLGREADEFIRGRIEAAAPQVGQQVRQQATDVMQDPELQKQIDDYINTRLSATLTPERFQQAGAGLMQGAQQQFWQPARQLWQPIGQGLQNMWLWAQPGLQQLGSYLGLTPQPQTNPLMALLQLLGGLFGGGAGQQQQPQQAPLPSNMQ
jgi:hypothetical protein